MRLPDLDLHLLRALLVLQRHRNLRRASEELGISHAAMSRGLAKLRREFNDPLFVPTARGMEPTPRALSAIEPASRIVEIARDQLAPVSSFDPTSSDRTFSIAASDVGELMLIPVLMRHCAAWPGIRFNAHRLAIKSLPDELQSGAVDVAVGAFPALENGIHCRRLFTEHYVGLVRAGHPALSSAFSLADFVASDHVVVSAGVLGHAHSRVEQALAQLLPARSVKATSSSFLLSALIAGESDCVLVAPSTLAALMKARCGLEIVPCPFETAPFDVLMYWHDRSHNDPAHRWLRMLIARHFGEVPPAHRSIR
ncbi:LysR family transcriptional regulator [Variovorax defluvii]|uniref:LysR family transcriptional regulator n=1 Tax=Variovorax defluvii TaxID=913761 RepID=A0ABP8ID30_9BURK